jgi:hypothetical protein
MREEAWVSPMYGKRLGEISTCESVADVVGELEERVFLLFDFFVR